MYAVDADTLVRSLEAVDADTPVRRIEADGAEGALVLVDESDLSKQLVVPGCHDYGESGSGDARIAVRYDA